MYHRTTFNRPLNMSQGLPPRPATPPAPPPKTGDTRRYHELSCCERATLAQNDPARYKALRAVHFSQVRDLQAKRNGARNIDERRALTAQLAEMTKTAPSEPHEAA